MSSGDKFFKEAAKKEKSFGWFGAAKEKNFEEAAELYTKAAAQFKQAEDFSNAGLAYEKAAECNLGAKNELEANNNWRESGKCYSHVDAAKAINAYHRAIQFYLDSDRFNNAARLADEIADILSDEGKFEEAIKSYEEAANYYNTENDSTNSNKRLEKMANIAIRLKKYEKAIPVYEKIAKTNVDNNLLRWNVKNYLFRASICVINRNIVDNDGKFWIDVSDTFQKYQNISDLFASSREAKLVEKLIDALKAVDIKAYKAAVDEFAHLNPLEKWASEQILIMEEYLKEKNVAAPDLMDDDEKNEVDNKNNKNNKNNNNNNNNNDDDDDDDDLKKKKKNNEKSHEQAKVYDPLKGGPLNNAPDLGLNDD